MTATSSNHPLRRPIPLLAIILAAVAVHGPLLLMQLPLGSYDAHFHIFFASHYAHHWFNPWNARWFGGFSQTTYPPLPQQWLALVSFLTGYKLAYMIVQMVAIILFASVDTALMHGRVRWLVGDVLRATRASEGLA